MVGSEVTCYNVNWWITHGWILPRGGVITGRVCYQQWYTNYFKTGMIKVLVERKVEGDVDC